MNPHDTPSRELLWDLIKNIKFAMFTTRNSSGHMQARPMTTQNKQLDEDDSLWFFMSRGSEPVTDLSVDPQVSVVYANPGNDSYVSVSGSARVVDDPAKKQQLWSPPNAAWFPGGVSDPDLVLVQVQIKHASYWDVKANKLVQLFVMAQAAVTGRPPKDLGQHGELRMR